LTKRDKIILVAARAMEQQHRHARLRACVIAEMKAIEHVVHARLISRSAAPRKATCPTRQ
jgi:hypothetical protein